MIRKSLSARGGEQGKCKPSKDAKGDTKRTEEGWNVEEKMFLSSQDFTLSLNAPHCYVH